MILDLESRLIFCPKSNLISSKGLIGFLEISFTICQPNCVLIGFDISPIEFKLNAVLTKISEFISPELKGFIKPPLEAELLSSENCLAKSSNEAPFNIEL